MNTKILVMALFCAGAFYHPVFAQGLFIFYNNSAPTHLGSLEGPLANTNIYAQLLAGPTPDSLAPVGIVRPHGANGLIGGAVTTVVPSVPAYSFAYVQMVAWDGILWGASLANVPLDQLGRTDIVTVYLSDGIFPMTGPYFTQSAIVPVPEPSVWALVALGAGATALARRRKQRD